MRDPNRLYDFYENLRNIHMTYFPDWRFGQFIYNFQNWYLLSHKKDVFYIEDDKMMKTIREYIIDMGPKYVN